jgi:hypothetical protein
VFILDPFQFGGNGIERFIPGDALEFPATPGAGALEWVEYTVGGVEPLPVSPTAETGTVLTVGFDTARFPAIDMDYQRADTAAMAGTNSVDSFHED